MKFAKWVNPKTNQTRIYVNGAAAWGIKVFVVDGGNTGTGKFASDGFPEIVVIADYQISRSEKDSIANRISDFVKNAVPSDVNPVFADFLILT